MLETLAAARTQAADPLSALHYERHRPDATLLYQLVKENLPCFIERVQAEGGRSLAFIEQEFEAYLPCGRLEG